MLLIGPVGTSFSEILIAILIFSFRKMRLKASSAQWLPFCPGLNVLNKTASHISPKDAIYWVPNLMALEIIDHQWPRLLTWFKSNPSMDK